MTKRSDKRKLKLKLPFHFDLGHAWLICLISMPEIRLLNLEGIKMGMEWVKHQGESKRTACWNDNWSVRSVRVIV